MGGDRLQKDARLDGWNLQTKVTLSRQAPSYIAEPLLAQHHSSRGKYVEPDGTRAACPTQLAQSDRVQGYAEGQKRVGVVLRR